MFKKFNVICQKDEEIYGVSKEAILDDAEEVCEQELKTQMLELQDQQEEVLKLQSLLKLFLIKRRNTKKQMNNDFMKYCMENYNLPMIFGDIFQEDDEFPVKRYFSYVPGGA